MNSKLMYPYIIFLICLLLCACSFQGNEPNSYSGLIEADELPIVAEVSGKITATFTEEGSLVTKDQVVATIDDQSYQISMKEAQAVLAYATVKVDEAKAGNRDQMIEKAAAAVEQANANVISAEARKRQASANLARAREQLTQAEADLAGGKRTLEYHQTRLREMAALYQNGAVSKKDYEAGQEAVNQAQTVVNRLTAQVEAMRTQVVSAKSEVDAIAADTAARQAQSKSALSELDLLREGSTDYTLKALLANQQQAVAKLEYARLQLDKTSIRVPEKGIVLRKNITEGEVAKQGTVLFTMMKESQLNLTMYIPEAELGSVMVGNIVKVQVDAYPNEQFTGKITSISEKAEFTPRNIQTKDERTKMVFAVKVQLQDGLDKLKPGMPADVFLQGEVKP